MLRRCLQACRVMYFADYIDVGPKSTGAYGDRNLQCPLVRRTDVGEYYSVTGTSAVSLGTLGSASSLCCLWSEMQDRWVQLPANKVLCSGNDRFLVGKGRVVVDPHSATVAALADWASGHWTLSVRT